MPPCQHFVFGEISSNLAQIFSWTQRWTDLILEVKGQVNLFCLVNVLSQEHLQGILSNLVKLFTQTQRWIDCNLEVRSQGGLTNFSVWNMTNLSKINQFNFSGQRSKVKGHGDVIRVCKNTVCRLKLHWLVKAPKHRLVILVFINSPKQISFLPLKTFFFKGLQRWFKMIMETSK